MSYSGKKRCHTSKIQVVQEKKSGRVLSIYQDYGRVHDFKVLKKSGVLKKISSECIVWVDLGYVGIKKIHKGAVIGYKKSKKKKLTREEKEHNKKVVKERITVEHTNGDLKNFRILGSKYRNKGKKLKFRVILITAFINLALSI